MFNVQNAGRKKKHNVKYIFFFLNKVYTAIATTNNYTVIINLYGREKELYLPKSTRRATVSARPSVGRQVYLPTSSFVTAANVASDIVRPASLSVSIIIPPLPA